MAKLSVRNLWLLVLCVGTSSAHTELLLTGRVDLLNPQEFVAPWSQNFQIAIQWMAEEGSKVAAGDVVVIFDPGELTTSIEQNEAALHDNAKGHQETLLRIGQELIDAEHALTQAQLRYEIAELKRDIPASKVSVLEHETAVFDFKKATSDLAQAEVKLQSKQLELANERRRIAFEIERIEAALANDQRSLADRFLRAERAGPVIYATHPWSGGKIDVGQSVQMGFKVAEIPANDAMIISAWVSEVDWPTVREGVQVQLTADAYLDQPFTGEIERIGYQSEKRTNWGRSSYYQVTINYAAPDGFELKPGMSILVQVPEIPARSLANGS